MPDHHRGRRHSRYDDYDDRYYADDDHYYHEPRPRHRSVGRQALDKISDAMESLDLKRTKSRRNSSSSTTRRRSHRHSYDDDDYYDDRPRDYYPPSSSSPHSHHHHRHHHSRRAYSTSPPRQRPSGRRPRRDSTTSSRSRVTSRSQTRLERGMQAAVDAAAVEAFRLRREPGPWVGAKGGRVATAALSAGVIGAAAEKRKQDHNTTKGLGTLGSAVGGLVVNRLVNGPRKELR